MLLSSVIDSLNIGSGSLIQAIGVGMGYSNYPVYLFVLTSMPFFWTTWETYYTGVLYLGYINGPTEGLLVAITMLCMSGVYGVKIWWTPYTLAGHSFLLIDGLLIGTLILSLTTQIPVSIYRVYVACKEKKLSFSSALNNVGAYYTMIALAYFWLTAPLSHAIQHHVVAVVISLGIQFGLITVIL